jgi:hypothetical protein
MKTENRNKKKTENQSNPNRKNLDRIGFDFKTKPIG